MQFTNTNIPGVMVVETEVHRDDRGHFARTFCAQEFAQAGIEFTVKQSNVSFNKQKGTLRGMHFQAEPYGEGKIVRCTRGAAFDVALDLRQDSSTFLRWTAHEISADNMVGLFIPPGCAHGFITLCDDTEIAYLMDTEYMPQYGRGVRWNDTAFSIDWPIKPKVISERDASFADFATRPNIKLP